MTKKAHLKRKEIITLTFQNMPEADFEQVTVKMICEAAGIAVGTFYHYFKDKADFFSYVYFFMDDYIEEMIVPMLTDENELVNLKRFYMGVAEYMADSDPRVTKILYTSFPSFSTEIERKRPFFCMVYRILERAREKRQIAEEVDINEMTRTSVVILRGFCYDWSRHEGNYDLADAVENCVSILIRGLLP